MVISSHSERRADLIRHCHATVYSAHENDVSLSNLGNRFYQSLLFLQESNRSNGTFVFQRFRSSAL